MSTKILDIAQVEQAVLRGFASARAAAAAKYRQVGERDACGFGWVTVYDVRSNSKIGKMLAEHGFRKAYGGGLQLWDPAKYPTQSVSVKESGAIAMATELESVGLTAFAGSRLD
jgi:hypothetical protein